MADPNPGSSGYWKDVNTYVGYYTCVDPHYPCPTEAQNPGWKIISKVSVAPGSHGGCSGCAVTEITWGRINIAPGTPAPTPVKKVIKLNYSIGSLKSSGGWTIDNAPYSQYGTIDQESAEQKYGGTGETALRNWLVTEGINYGHFSINDTIYDKNGNLITKIPSIPTTQGCTEGKTRQVICPKNGKLITQNCVGNAWITIKADETKCLSGGGIDLTQFIVSLIIVIIIFYFIMRGK